MRLQAHQYKAKLKLPFGGFSMFRCRLYLPWSIESDLFYL